MTKTKEWFAVDKDGLKEMYANFPLERMVSELIQNSWDCDECSVCAVEIKNTKKHTIVTVIDDHPEGFKNISDAYTLFGSTAKRGDPTKRGRFNLGEKLVFARADEATVATTTGTIRFTDKGRTELSKCTDSGSMITAKFPRCTDAELDTALEFLKAMYRPKDVKYQLCGKEIPYRKPVKKTKTKMSTEFIKQIDGGQGVMTKTKRMTEIWFYKKQRDQAFLYELGIPVCELDGKFDVDIQQKIPLSQDRTVVPQSYMQDVYAELYLNMHEQIAPGDLGQSSTRIALEDERMTPEVAAKIFKQQYGDNAVIQSHDADSDQEAARHNATIVNSRTFGSDVNHKLRDGGIQTTKEVYCRDRDELEGSLGLPKGFKEVKDNPSRDNLTAYVKMLGKELQGRELSIKYASWHSSTVAFYRKGGEVTFNVLKIPTIKMKTPVSKLSSLILHEISHSLGDGHDSVYDHAFEELVDKHTYLLATQPEKYREFEPDLFPAIVTYDDMLSV